MNINNQDISPRGNFDFSKLFVATKDFIDQHNTNNPETKTKLNANHRATAELITRLYAKQLNKGISLGDSLEDGLPGFKTYNSSLATCKGCTVRTIRNHKERLKSSGFITKEVNHGANGIELYLNSEIFSENEILNSTLILNSKKSLKNLEKSGLGKNFPPLVHVHQEHNNINSDVDNKERRLSTPSDNENYVTGTIQEQHRNTVESKKPEINKQEGAQKIIAQNQDTVGSEKAAVENNNNKPAAVTSDNQPDTQYLLALVQQFWFYAKNILFKDMVLTEAENTDILNLIWHSVYRKFKVKGTVKDYQKYQDILYNRIDMVAKWLDRNPNRWIPVPEIYFSPHNDRNGFNKTHEWYVKQEALKIAVRNELLLQNANKEWEDHDKGKGKHRKKSRIQLFQLQQKRLSKYKDEKLIQEYQKIVHKHNILRNHDTQYRE